MRNEEAFEEALGYEIENMPHDYDSLRDWAMEFLESYERSLRKIAARKGHNGDTRCSDCPCRYGIHCRTKGTDKL